MKKLISLLITLVLLTSTVGYGQVVESDLPTALKQIVDSPNETTILFLTASWCPYCKEQEKILQEVAKEKGVRFLKLDVDKNNIQVQSVPGLVFIKKGKSVYGKPGVHPKATVLELLEKFK